MFAGHRRGLAFAMKNGDKVIVGGSVDAVSYTHLDPETQWKG